MKYPMPSVGIFKLARRVFEYYASRREISKLWTFWESFSDGSAQSDAFGKLQGLQKALCYLYMWRSSKIFIEWFSWWDNVIPPPFDQEVIEVGRMVATWHNGFSDLSDCYREIGQRDRRNRQLILQG